MRRKLTTIAAVAALTAFGAMPAMAKADGQCVSNGVKALGGPTIAAVANGSVDLGVSVSDIIKDHAFNGADVTESVLGVTICD